MSWRSRECDNDMEFVLEVEEGTMEQLHKVGEGTSIISSMAAMIPAYVDSGFS